VQDINIVKPKQIRGFACFWRFPIPRAPLK
jgi:hypothetical protein